MPVPLANESSNQTSHILVPIKAAAKDLQCLTETIQESQTDDTSTSSFTNSGCSFFSVDTLVLKTTGQAAINERGNFFWKHPQKQE
jgi:hypothetical protein